MANDFFLAYDAQTRTHLWVSDPDGSNAHQLPDKVNDSTANFFSPGGLFASNGKVFFSAYPSTDQVTDFFGEPFVSDGTSAGTFLLKDIKPGRGGSSPVFKATLGGQVLFNAADGTGKLGLYATDGTAAGTLLLNNSFAPVPNYGTAVNRAPDDFTVFKGGAYFTAQSATYGRELWTTDGTVDGTQLLLNIGTGDTGSSLYSASPRLLTVVGDTLFFAATSPMTQAEGLWSTDGASGGTHLVKDIYPTGFGSLLAEFTPFLGKLYFSANNSSGDEIWVSDGTSTGTQVLKDINAGGGSSGPANFTVAGSTLFFTATVPYVTGTELYATDGTAAGTRRVLDIQPGSGDSLPTQLHGLGSRVVFVADDGTHGKEVWSSDGTAAGTVILSDIYAGVASSAPDMLTRSGSLVYFVATSPTRGRSCG